MYGREEGGRLTITHAHTEGAPRGGESVKAEREVGTERRRGKTQGDEEKKTFKLLPLSS